MGIYTGGVNPGLFVVTDVADLANSGKLPEEAMTVEVCFGLVYCLFFVFVA